MKHYMLAASLLVVAILGCIAGMLILEYRYFRGCTRELLEVKKEYEEYVLTYKKLVNGYCTIQSSNDREGVRTDTQSARPFELVNRDPAYLIESAAQYGRQYNLENSVRQLYTLEPADKNGAHPRRLQSKKLQTKPSIKNKTNAAALYMKRGDAIFHWPIERSQFWISCKFGPRKKNKGNKGVWELHRGIDLAAIEGTPVLASASGVVVEVAYSKKGYGKTVVLAHRNNFTTRYAHLQNIYVNLGQSIPDGYLLGRVGTTGNVRGKHGRKSASHLHFEVKERGKPINPQLVLL